MCFFFLSNLYTDQVYGIFTYSLGLSVLSALGQEKGTNTRNAVLGAEHQEKTQQ